MLTENKEFWGRFKNKEKTGQLLYITNHIKYTDENVIRDYIRKLETWEIVKFKLDGTFKLYYVGNI